MHTKAYRREWYRKNKDKFAISHARWRAKNPTYHRDYMRKRWQSDPVFRLKGNLRSRLNRAVSGKGKSASTMAILGCTIEFFKAHIASQMWPGMTWENYGRVWHIDHRVPVAKFDLSNPQHVKTCFNYRNLQPLFKGENLRKNNKFIP